MCSLSLAAICSSLEAFSEHTQMSRWLDLQSRSPRLCFCLSATVKNKEVRWLQELIDNTPRLVCSVFPPSFSPPRMASVLLRCGCSGCVFKSILYSPLWSSERKWMNTFCFSDCILIYGATKNLIIRLLVAVFPYRHVAAWCHTHEIPPPSPKSCSLTMTSSGFSCQVGNILCKMLNVWYM